MKKMSVLYLAFLFVSCLYAGQLTVEGTYTTSFKSNTPYTFKGTLSSKSDTEYEGEITAPWNGKDQFYKGTISGKPGSGSLAGDFIMTSSKRHFTFTINPGGSNYSGNALEGGKIVGVLSVRVSGGESSAAASSSVPDISEAVAEAVSKQTGISKETVLELFKNKGISKDEVIAVCAAAELTKGDTAELYKKRKKVNTNFEFLYDLKLEKDTKASVEALIKKIKAALEEEKNKKK